MLMIKVDVKLINGEEDSCIVSIEDALTIAETFLEKGVLMIGDPKSFTSIYPAHSVFSFCMYSKED